MHNFIPHLFLSNVHSESFSKFHLWFLFPCTLHILYSNKELSQLSLAILITWKAIRFQIVCYFISSSWCHSISKFPRISERLHISSWHLRNTICLANIKLEESSFWFLFTQVDFLCFWNVTCQFQEVSVVLIFFWHTSPLTQGEFLSTLIL